MKHIFPQQRSCLFTKLTFILFGLAMTQGSFSNNLFFNTVWIRSSFLFIHSTINSLSFRFSGYQPSISRRRFLLQFWRPNSLATWTSQERFRTCPRWQRVWIFLFGSLFMFFLQPGYIFRCQWKTAVWTTSIGQV